MLDEPFAFRSIGEISATIAARCARYRQLVSLFGGNGCAAQIIEMVIP